MKPHIAVVIQRFGKDVMGGAEKHAEQAVEALKDNFKITVITTTAFDYLTWKNHYPQGSSFEGNVEIVRFPVKREREIQSFNEYSEKFFSKPVKTLSDEEDWFNLQGPECPELIEYLKSNYHSFDCFVFFTYLYYTTVYGLPMVGDKSILIPTSHNEPPIHLQKIKDVFSKTWGLLFNTDSERQMVYRIHPEAAKRSVIGGIFIECPKNIKTLSRPFEGKYCLYFGRLERGKGIYELFDNFLALKSLHPDLHLVCLGKSNPEIKPRMGIVFPGFVSDEEKWAYIYHSEFIVMPSQLESLSMTLLEGFAAGKPALVNANCDVLVDHCRKSNAGMWYADYEEFIEEAEMLINSHKLCKEMGKKGADYVKNYYSRERIGGIYTDFINKLIESRNQ
jgi:glycosyltransferase involved in cell wall biosynthesis